MSPARLLDGKATAAAVRGEVQREVARLRAAGTVPRLAVVLVGEDPASEVYVRNKDKAAREAGFEARTRKFPATIQQAALEAEVRALSADPSVHGILVQLPLPKGLAPARIVRLIDPRKDVDGLHPENVAALAMGEAGLRPCTPAGCVEILERNDLSLEGRRVVVLGRSLLVGKPFALLALERNATVTIAHSKTRELAELCRMADVLVAAIGRPRLVQGDWIRPGAVVLDVGINRLADGKLAGDVDFDAALPHAGAITPVPGGIGPMTIAMLLHNTALAAARQAGLEKASLLARERR